MCKLETEASGGINLDNVVSYAATGVDFVSIGAVIHAVSADLSLTSSIDLKRLLPYRKNKPDNKGYVYSTDPGFSFEEDKTKQHYQRTNNPFG